MYLNLYNHLKKVNPVFFKVLPDGEGSKGDSWTTSYLTSTGKVDAVYTLTDFNDSTILIDFKESSITITKAEMMGGETTTKMNNESTGKIILDRFTGIIKEKTITTDSKGNAETSFGTLPVTSKTTIVITVNPVAEK